MSDGRATKWQRRRKAALILIGWVIFAMVAILLYPWLTETFTLETRVLMLGFLLFMQLSYAVNSITERLEGVEISVSALDQKIDELRGVPEYSESDEFWDRMAGRK